MGFIWKILSTLILVTVFITLSVFSLIEYRDGDISSREDKLPFVKTALNILSYIEKMPTIRLLPAAMSADYEDNMVTIINEKKPDIENKLELTGINIPKDHNLENAWKRLREELSRDWSRPSK